LTRQGAHGIRANALLPGSTEFPGGGWAMLREHQPGIYEMVRWTVPSRRLGTPKEVADAAVWLVSPRAGWVNGAALVVDGGQSRVIP
jgi:3-oxoacyl-[acyl-carrier protein] reductase